MKQASCYGVLNGYQAYDILFFLHVLEDLLEGVAANQFQFLALEVTVRGYVVEASLNTLYCYSSHFLSKKNPARCGAGPYCLFLFVLFFCSVFWHI